MRAAKQRRGRTNANVLQPTPDILNTDYVKSSIDMSETIEKIARSLALSGFPRRDIVGVKVSLEEAVLNSFKHAYHGLPGQTVIIQHAIDGDEVWLQVQDQGCGFNPAFVPDPTLPENWERESGRGLLMMRSYMVSVTFNDSGNCVTLSKRSSVPLASE